MDGPLGTLDTLAFDHFWFEVKKRLFIALTLAFFFWWLHLRFQNHKSGVNIVRWPCLTKHVIIISVCCHRSYSHHHCTTTLSGQSNVSESLCSDTWAYFTSTLCCPQTYTHTSGPFWTSYTLAKTPCGQHRPSAGSRHFSIIAFIIQATSLFLSQLLYPCFPFLSVFFPFISPLPLKGGVGNFGETSLSALESPYRAPPPTHTNVHTTNEGTR